MPRTEAPTLFPAPAAEPGSTFAQVVFNRPLEQAFSYVVPPELADQLAIGKRVLAPFGRGNRPAVGYCVEVTHQPLDRADKAISRILDDEPLLTPELLRLTKWMADYYLCGWGQVLDAVLPAAARALAGTRLRKLLVAVPEDRLPQPPRKLTPKQARAYSVLRAEDRPMDPSALARSADCTVSVVMELARKGFATQETARVESPRRIESPAPAEEPIVMNSDQLRAQSAIERAVSASGFHAFLLRGVTGSGKTEIYLQAIQRVVSQGKEALVLVPEISLTPQLIARFRGRFPHVAVLHSHLGDAERGWHWRQIASGKAQVVVGARSAVFAPTRRLGLIVVDEEHETSFKQETTPRYHGRDVAVMRARLENVPIILGSATPSLESWHNTQRGQYTLLSLPLRVLDRPLPQVNLIDLRHEPVTRGRYRALSPTLEKAIRDALDQGGQVILLLNRRGFSTYIHCPACGHVVQCRFCDVALTHHRHRDVALCHYCGYEADPPERCPACGLAQVSYHGQGTEKLEAEIAQKFPGVPAVRMDSDSMRRPGSHAKALDSFRRGEVRILFGTQMIAKGLDFPNVTLVGVVNADTVLHMPDFRAAERTFQLVAQVAGRTGRGPRGGRVLVQTYDPQTPCIALAAGHDYLAFADQELRNRHAHLYPPYNRLARVILRSRDPEAVDRFAHQLAGAFRQALLLPSPLRGRGAGPSSPLATGGRGAGGEGEPHAKPQAAPSLRLLGPAEAPLFKLQGYYRYHFQLQSSSSAVLHEVLKETLSACRPSKGVELAVDVDPLSML